MTGATLEVLSSQCTKLSKLHLQGCDLAPKITLSPLPKLQLLNLSHCRNVTDDLLHQFAALCPLISEFIFTSCHSVSDESLEHLLYDMSALQHLQLSGVNWSGDTVAVDAAYPSLALQSLCVRGCRSLCADGYRFILLSLKPTLMSLDLSGSDVVDDALLATVCDTFQRIETLIATNTAVTSACAPSVHRLRRLRHVDISDCKRMDYVEMLHRLFAGDAPRHPSLQLLCCGDYQNRLPHSQIELLEELTARVAATSPAVKLIVKSPDFVVEGSRAKSPCVVRGVWSSAK